MTTRRLKQLTFLAIVLVGGAIAWWLWLPYGDLLFGDNPEEIQKSSIECAFPWENFRVLRQATTPYINSATDSGFTVVYYEQVSVKGRDKVVALYRGPHDSWETCRGKLDKQYGNAVVLSASDHPYAIVISEGTVAVLYTRNKSRARPLDKLPIIGTAREAFYVEDLEAVNQRNQR